jgi:hypothetical protein
VGNVRRSQVAAAIAALVLCAAFADSGSASAEIRNLSKPGAFAVQAPAGVSFEARGRIEQQTARGWKPVFNEFYLAENCAAVAALSACVTIAPGAGLRPVSWTGFTCNGQCPRACKKNIYRPPGTFRLVLTACGGGTTEAGPPFSMGARER